MDSQSVSQGIFQEIAGPQKKKINLHGLSNNENGDGMAPP